MRTFDAVGLCHHKNGVSGHPSFIQLRARFEWLLDSEHARDGKTPRNNLESKS